MMVIAVESQTTPDPSKVFTCKADPTKGVPICVLTVGDRFAYSQWMDPIRPAILSRPRPPRMLIAKSDHTSQFIVKGKEETAKFRDPFVALSPGGTGDKPDPASTGATGTTSLTPAITEADDQKVCTAH
ncbi:hypothetical protein MJO28_001634 [Puccinia striiformis f. sp. tritici]|uniref:Uncharacterized protein n=1 Tax=Puccinia striiformis f. sp. tritici TaxID=168172 RepID=A0ACC0EUJ3_9BASI|nr:hypothetical protein MJO28_001634 [Puccinia striiformis f. sp. tritici]KAI7965927.1 hypothetical protein MJO29_001675 [Puccinia striiformis f. sp. tritici]